MRIASARSTVGPVWLPAVRNRGITCGVPCPPECFLLQVVAAALITRIYMYIFFFLLRSLLLWCMVYGVCILTHDVRGLPPRSFGRCGHSLRRALDDAVNSSFPMMNNP